MEKYDIIYLETKTKLNLLKGVNMKFSVGEKVAVTNLDSIDIMLGGLSDKEVVTITEFMSAKEKNDMVMCKKENGEIIPLGVYQLLKLKKKTKEETITIAKKEYEELLFDSFMLSMYLDDEEE